MTLSVLSLFSGIGAMDLGLERTAGFKTTAFVEIDPFCRRVLAKHWPGVPCYDDVRTLTGARLAADGIVPDVIIGGFPCQPHSVAGTRGASGDERDLWPEFARLVREIRPRWVLAENVPGLRSSEAGRFFGGILRDLAGTGYRVEWRSISASDMGAPHRRERVWIVAYPNVRNGGQGGPWRSAGLDTGLREQALADACEPGLSHAIAQGGNGGLLPRANGRAAAERCGGRGVESCLGGSLDGVAAGLHGPWGADWEDGIPRVAHGVPDRVSRLKALGNSLVPQIPEMLGRAILAAERE